MRAMLCSVVLVMGGCEDFLDVPPPGQTFDGTDVGLSFVDATAAAGISGEGESYGAGWGDLDGDGDPDLWVGNHGRAPSVFLNGGDGAFAESGAAWLGVPAAYDAHGVNFVDLDGDGRLDLLEAVGANSGDGAGANRVYLQGDGGLVDRAADLGLDYPLGSGRCPVVYDWNLDGRLDVFWVNQPRADGLAPSALFSQTDDGTFGLQAEVPLASQHPTALCGELADLDGDRVMELVRFGRPTHLSAHDARSATLRDVSADVGLPPANRPHDVLVADLDNDLRNDIYVTRWEETSALVVAEDGRGLDVALRLFDTDEGVTFRTTGQVTITLDPPYFWGPGSIRAGAGCEVVPVLDPTFTAEDASVAGLCAFTGGEDRGLYVGLVDGVWHVRLSTDVYDRGAFTVRSTALITDITDDLTTLSEEDTASFFRDRLFIGVDGGFEDQGWNRGIQQYTQCESVVAADLDNDMDLDLYLACATPVGNTDNLVYRNDGQGRFSLLAGHGAEGTRAGRADSVVVADYDLDGFLDLFVTNGYANPPFNGGPLQLFRNQGNDHHWLLVDLQGVHGYAVGSTLLVTAGGVTQLREADGGTHHMGQHHTRLHVGLGTHEVVDRLEVIWPDGARQVLEDVVADQLLRIEQDR